MSTVIFRVQKKVKKGEKAKFAEVEMDADEIRSLAEDIKESDYYGSGYKDKLSSLLKEADLVEPEDYTVAVSLSIDMVAADPDTAMTVVRTRLERLFKNDADIRIDEVDVW